MIPDFAIEHPDGRRAILEIVGFWTPEYLDAKLERFERWRPTISCWLSRSNWIVRARSSGSAADRVLWFKTGIHVYDVVDLVEQYATGMSQSEEQA